uniref:DUF4220 domain-containing protein n=1 Tax=Oryza punctata TaxID=4537 RepID=A0A0E0KMI2_ORYPU
MPGWNFVTIKDFLIISSAAHVGLVLFAGVRRHSATGLWRLVLWVANQVARWAPTAALGKLSVGSTVEQEQLRTLWVAFMLLHAGMPDNITAYALEDTVMSMRKVVSVFLQLIGPVSPFAILFKNIFSNNDDPMLWVSSLICCMAIVRYGEGAFWALWLGNLENMRSSIKEEEEKNRPRRRSSLQSAMRGGSTPDDEQILLIAHDMLYITKNAFVDYLDKSNDEQEALSATWDDILYKVVNMELSLMYDMIYTKATKVHTCCGYAIRLASPIAGAAAWLLSWFHSKEGQARGEVVITYAMLAGTFILDIIWLLRAAASTWTYSFLNDRPRCWLHHALLCSGKWRVIRRVIVSLNLFRFIANKEPSSYRMWSGTIGQYNLLHECTRDDEDAGETTSNCVSYVLKKLSEIKYLGFSSSHWMEYEYHYWRGNREIDSQYFRKELFSYIWEVMKKPFPQRRGQRIMAQMAEAGETAAWVEESRHAHQEADIALKFTPDLQETILILHIATDIVLLLAESEIEASAQSRQQVKAIKVLSDYMMFLVAVRPGMVPGLVLSSRYEAVRDALARIWKERTQGRDISTTREKVLARILINLENTDGSNTERDDLMPDSGFLSVLYDMNNVLSEGALLAKFLLHRRTDNPIPPKLKEKFDRQFPDLMDLVDDEFPTEAIVTEWARQLINVSIRCTRDSHAKQLARGGELTTIVWILAEHARILRVERTTE